jgi:hypothetical protein
MSVTPRLVSVIGFALLAALCATAPARAQLSYPLSPRSVLSAEPCHPAAGCSVFHDGPRFPDDGAPIGQRVRIRIAASEETVKDRPVNDRRDEGQLVNTLHDMFAALRVCWVPPPPDKSRPGMEYTIVFAFKRNGELLAPARVTYATHGVPDEVRNVYHEAVEAALRRCTPMHFSTGMAGAIAGHPIALRFFDDRIMIEHFKNSDDANK